MSTLLKLSLADVAAEKDGVDLLSEGNHLLKVEAVEIKETKKGGGFYIAASLRVKGGIDGGKSLMEFINIVNSNEDAQRLGLARLKRILEVGGHKNPSYVEDAKELIGLEFVGQVVNKEEEWTNTRGEKVVSVKSTLYKVKDVGGFEAMTEQPLPMVTPAPKAKKTAAAPAMPAVPPVIPQTAMPAVPPVIPQTAAPSFPWSR